MNKAECLERAGKAKAEAAAATKRAALYAVTFGGNDALSLSEMERVSAANDAAREWEAVAKLHPKTRAALIRANRLPVSMFGF